MLPKINPRHKIRKALFGLTTGGGVIRYNEGVSIRYTERASIRYRATSLTIITVFRFTSGFPGTL